MYELESACSDLGESSSPFIDEGNGLTSERERVRLLVSLAAHAGGFKMFVGTHNTVDAQRHVGEPYRMRVNSAHNTVGKKSVPTILFVSGRLQSIVSAGV